MQRLVVVLALICASCRVFSTVKFRSHRNRVGIVILGRPSASVTLVMEISQVVTNSSIFQIKKWIETKSKESGTILLSSKDRRVFKENGNPVLLRLLRFRSLLYQDFDFSICALSTRLRCAPTFTLSVRHNSSLVDNLSCDSSCAFVQFGVSGVSRYRRRKLRVLDRRLCALDQDVHANWQSVCRYYAGLCSLSDLHSCRCER